VRQAFNRVVVRSSTFPQPCLLKLCAGKPVFGPKKTKDEMIVIKKRTRLDTS
jgi:hypothetical protein